MLTSVHHPVHTMITEVNVGMAARDYVSESKFITTAKIGLPSATCSHYLPLLFMGSFHKSVPQITPQKESG